MSTITGNGNENAWPRRAARYGPALAWMGLIFALSAQRTVPEPPGLGSELTAALGHVGAYLVLAILLWWGLGGLGFEDRPRLAIAFGLAVLYGIGDEWHQSFVPGRHPDLLDLIVDATGAACGLLAIHWAPTRWPTPGDCPIPNLVRLRSRGTKDHLRP